MYCPFCGEPFREGDDCIYICVGNMAWGDGSLALYCDPYIKPGGRRVEMLMHSNCFIDGPVWEENELLSVNATLETSYNPECTVCGSRMTPGDQVFMFQSGAIVNGKFEIDALAQLSSTKHIRAAYCHTECVCAEAAVHLPNPPSYSYTPV